AETAAAGNSLGMVFLLRKQYGAAKKQFLEAIALYEAREPVPKGELCSVLINLCMMYQESGEFSPVGTTIPKIEDCVTLIAGNTSSFILLQAAVQLFIKTGHEAEAVPVLERIVQIGRTPLETPLQVTRYLDNSTVLGSCLRTIGEYERAADVIEH